MKLMSIRNWALLTKIPKLMNRKSIYGILSVVLLLSGVLACKTPSGIQRGQAPKIDSAKAGIVFQEKKKYVFNEGKVVFDNRFAAARLNKVIQLNDSTFQADILPENTPVNPSPWYAFKVWSGLNRNIYVRLNYGGARHRYDPKIKEGMGWKELKGLKVSADQRTATFKLGHLKDTVCIAAQELRSAVEAWHWCDSLASLSFVHRQTIGYSLLGKPIVALNTTDSKGKKLVVVLSGQHPPEVTGFMAMQAFVETLTGDTELALKFRKEYELVVVPLINPDGVDQGNWRHSAAGVDLNRDWENFVQPETRAVKEFLLEKLKYQKAKAYFGIDFHSTFYDVFYINEDQPLQPTNIPQFTRKWLQAMTQSIADFKPNVKPSPNGGNVSKSWMGRVLKAEALTYEVGDDSSRPVLKMKGRVAAEQMMKLLMIER
ncbi:hypothetical protein DBR11_21510 [Pedobacter sp. HMWF019]|uniref:M14 family metallopeptidase n=1 Tax=Pedobacter sp. HMWF019 TaxID=2056856 RepID=UPI000D3C1687|nr:M14 family metallopeptidase [Pedobacter sp. HMWF019]PTS95365.1 hypothetical protein DBR11_21510 [Pedobacter sp. HMWF019]